MVNNKLHFQLAPYNRKRQNCRGLYKLILNYKIEQEFIKKYKNQTIYLSNFDRNNLHRFNDNEYGDYLVEENYRLRFINDLGYLKNNDKSLFISGKKNTTSIRYFTDKKLAIEYIKKITSIIKSLSLKV